MPSLIEAIEIKRKMFFEFENAPYHCLDVEVSKPTARGGQTLVRIKMRNLLTRAVFDKTFKAGEKFGEPDLESVDATFLYADADGYHFMDQESFETITLRPDLVGDDRLLLADNVLVEIQKYNGGPSACSFRRIVELTVMSSEPGVRGNTAGGVTKTATLETGLSIQVPLFIKDGEKVKVHTETREFAGERRGGGGTLSLSRRQPQFRPPRRAATRPARSSRRRARRGRARSPGRGRSRAPLRRRARRAAARHRACPSIPGPSSSTAMTMAGPSAAADRMTRDRPHLQALSSRLPSISSRSSRWPRTTCRPATSHVDASRPRSACSRVQRARRGRRPIHVTGAARRRASRPTPPRARARGDSRSAAACARPAARSRRRARRWPAASARVRFVREHGQRRLQAVREIAGLGDRAR